MQVMSEVIDVAVAELQEHPALEQIPMLPACQFEALKQSLLTYGPLKPLAVVRGEEPTAPWRASPADGHPSKEGIKSENGRWLVIDGRNRLAAHRELGTPRVAAMVCEPGTDPLTYAIESAVAGRNLTKSGIVLMLFLGHPEILKERANRRGGRRGQETVISENSYRQLAGRYMVPHYYFSTLADIHAKCQASGDEAAWDEAKRAILEEEVSIPHVHAGIGSRLSDHTKKRRDPHYEQLLFSLPGTIVNAFKQWGRVGWSEDFPREAALEKVREMVAAMPDEVRAVTVDAVVESWPEHDQKTLFKALVERAKRKGRG